MSSEVPMQAATEQASKVKDVAMGQVADVAHEAQAKATDLLQEVKDQLMREAGNQGERLSGVMRDVSGQLRSMAGGGAPGPVRDLTTQAAGALGDAADRLGDRGVSGALDDLTSFARRRPGAFLVGAGLAGFAAARLFRNAPSSGGSSPGLAQPSPSAPPMLTASEPLGSASVPGGIGSGD